MASRNPDKHKKFSIKWLSSHFYYVSMTCYADPCLIARPRYGTLLTYWKHQRYDHHKSYLEATSMMLVEFTKYGQKFLGGISRREEMTDEQRAAWEAFQVHFDKQLEEGELQPGLGYSWD